MKMNVLLLMGGGKAELAKKAKVAPGFETALKARVEPTKESAKEQGKERPAKDEKKARLTSSSEEALLVSRALVNHARPAPLVGTKPQEPKVEHAKIGADQLATRVKGQAEHARVTPPAEAKKAARVSDAEPELKEHARGEEPLLQTGTTQAAAPAAEPFHIEAPQALKDAAPLAQVAPMMLDDASVRAVLMPNIARVSMNTGEAGELKLQLKVHDGITDVRATGPAAQLFESRQGELRVALAREGLALGHFDLTQSDSQQRHAERPDFDPAAPTARRATSSSTADTATEDGRVHVKV